MSLHILDFLQLAIKCGGISRFSFVLESRELSILDPKHYEDFHIGFGSRRKSFRQDMQC